MLLAFLFVIILPALTANIVDTDSEETPEGTSSQPCQETDDMDTCSLLQPSRPSVRLERASSESSGCLAVLPLLAQVDDISGICQQSLPMGVCSDAINALGALPWPEEMVAKACARWSDAVATQRLSNSKLAVLLSRSTSIRRQGMHDEQLEAALRWKGDEQPLVKQPPYNTSNKTNTTKSSNQTANTTTAAPGNSSNQTANTTTAAPGSTNSSTSSKNTTTGASGTTAAAAATKSTIAAATTTVAPGTSAATRANKTTVAAATGPQASQFLIISSPTEKKVVWTPLVNFRSSEGRAFALVDDGLSEPKGIAFDDRRGLLYVADSGAKAIFRYTVIIDVSPERRPQLKTTGVRLTIVQGQEVEWVTVDKEGDLFYTCPRTNNINKVSSEVMQNLADGKLQPSALHLISEKTLMKEVIEDNKKKALFDKLNPNHLPIDAPPAKPHILQIYEASLNPHVAAPAAIRADNGELFWTNVANGTTAGTVVKALVHPENATGNHSLNLSKPFPAEALTNISAGAYGLAKTRNAMFFTRNGTLPNTGVVSAILLSNPSIVLDFVKTIARPRGLVWDHDQTMYVTDQDAGCVWSFPIGRLMANAPLTKAVNINGAYDLRILSSTAPAFTRNEVTEVNRNG